MAWMDNIFGLSVMAFILIFSLIHLGVGIGIIAPYREYEDIFRPQIGLASFNLVISIFGFLTGGLGLFVVLKQADRFGRIVVLISGTLAIFSIASLIAALVINSKSLSYLNSQYRDHMYAYKGNADSQMIIDKLNDKYDCCGIDTWLDWSQAGLNTVIATSTAATSSSTTAVLTTINTTSITTASTMNTASSTAVITTGAPITTLPSNTPTTSAAGKRIVREIENNDRAHHRQVRQIVANYTSIPFLPTSYVVILPGSCCQSGAVLSNSTGYCASANNGVENKINPQSCLKPMDVTAGNHAMGIGVINCFMIVLSIIAIPLLLKSPGPYI